MFVWIRVWLLAKRGGETYFDLPHGAKLSNVVYMWHSKIRKVCQAQFIESKLIEGVTKNHKSDDMREVTPKHSRLYSNNGELLREFSFYAIQVAKGEICVRLQCVVVSRD